MDDNSKAQIFKQANEWLKENALANDFSHSEFVNGINSGMLKVVYDLQVNFYEICPPRTKNALAIIHILCNAIPMIAVIVFAIVCHNWWYLIGLVIGYFAVLFAQTSGNKLTVYLLLFSIGWWFFNGFHIKDYFTFFVLVFMISQVLQLIEVEYDVMFVKNGMIESEEYYNRVRKIVTILKHPDLIQKQN